VLERVELIGPKASNNSLSHMKAISFDLNNSLLIILTFKYKYFLDSQGSI